MRLGYLLEAFGVASMVVVLMGVSGSGKSTIGEMLASALKWRFYDADSLHSAANREKMRRGIPLTDSDRMPWLRRVRRVIEKCLKAGTDAIVACSALKQSYRDIIVVDADRVQIVYLKGSAELLAGRLADRQGHFMPADLLPSQMATLEEPRDAITVDVSGTPRQIVGAIRAALEI
ncbi:MAG TPA: gluconokinase [Candidatus Binataceae bacterium]|nr:gluconokinase [Candidatus Binataceae bacterium]